MYDNCLYTLIINKIFINYEKISLLKSLFVVLALSLFSVSAFAEDGVWTLVSDASKLAIGDKIVIAATDYDYAISTTQNKNNRGQAAITKTNSTITIGETVQILTLEAGVVDNTFAFNTGSGYLYAASSSGNYLKTQTTNNANGSWSIAIDAKGVATVVAKGTSTRATMQYNQQSSLFACYSSATQKAISIYKLEDGTAEEVVATAITLDQTTLALEQYHEAQLIATLTPADATTLVEWTTSDATIATVKNGFVTAKAVGTATITAKAGELTATCAVTVAEATVLTCAKAAEYAASVSGNNVNYVGGQYVVRGYVTEIATAYDENYKNISVWMADTKDGGKVFELYRGKSTNETICKVGDYIEVVGYLTKYNTTPETAQGATYTVIAEPKLPMEVEFENIAAIYKMGMWDVKYYESYDQNSVKAILNSQPTVVDKVVAVGAAGLFNNYYLNDGTGVIVLQTPADDPNAWPEPIEGLNIEVGKKLPAGLLAGIDFKTIVDEETYLPNGNVYGAPVMIYVPRETGDTIVDEEGFETLVTESNTDFVARCVDSDFVEDTVRVTVDELLANRMQYAGKLLVVDTIANYYAEVSTDNISGVTSTKAYMYWDADEAFDVESFEEEGITYVFVSPKYTEDYNNYVGKLFSVQAENLPKAALNANATINVAVARFDWNSIAIGQTFLAKEFEVKNAGEGPGVDVENSKLAVNIYSNNGAVCVETEAGAMIEVYTVDGLRLFAGVSNTNTTIINGLNTNVAIISVNGEAYKVCVK